MKRKEPRWVVPFLRALERTGEARAAAKDAGIDHSTAYARRKAHGEFADAWAAALRAHGVRVKAEEEAEIGALRSGRTAPSPGSPPASPTSPPERGRGEELVVSGGKVRRVGRERWGKRREAIFFEELAATANATLAAEAAGVSTNAVFARRLKHPLFRAKWEAVVRTAKASIDLYLIEETRKAFDPGTIDTATVTPKVTIDQAIRISQLNGPRKQEGLPADPFEDGAGAIGAYDVEDVRRRLEAKMDRIGECERRRQLALGWSYDERFEVMVPPGYIQGPEYEPNAPDSDGAD